MPFDFSVNGIRRTMPKQRKTLGQQFQGLRPSKSNKLHAGGRGMRIAGQDS